MLSSADLDAMQATLAESLPELAEITRATKASDSRGGTTLTWATVASVPCRIAPMMRPAVDTVTGDLVTNTQRWILTFPAGTSVAADDRVVVGARTFTVITVKAARSYATSCRADAIEIL